MNNKVVLLQGGKSEEREVSLQTSRAVKKALQNNNKVVIIMDPANFIVNDKINYQDLINKLKDINPDVVFIGLHGKEGEDGTIQKVFEIFDINFTGSCSQGCFISMDKQISKMIAKYLKIPTPEYLAFKQNEKIEIKKIIQKFSLPLVVKPNNSGSSVGVNIVEDKSMIMEATKEAYKYSDKILIEKYIHSKEITVAILGNKALPVVEVKAKNGWYDYTHKYTKGTTIYEIPAKLIPAAIERVKNYAQKIFRECNCNDYARVDFRYNGKDFYFLELNTLPGMTDLSLVPMAAKAEGISFDELIRIITEKDWKFNKLS